MHITEEKAFVRRLKQMDERAWQAFCRDYSLPLLSFVRLKFGCSQEKAEEIVQMTFFRCVKSIKSFRASQGQLLSWLKVISKNEAITLLRQEQKQSAAKQSIINSGSGIKEMAEQIDTEALSDEILSKAENQLLIHETLAGLKNQYQRALRLKYVENRKVTEIAVIFNLSENAVASLLFRSRQAFRELFLKKARAAAIEESGLLK